MVFPAINRHHVKLEESGTDTEDETELLLSVDYLGKRCQELTRVNEQVLTKVKRL